MLNITLHPEVVHTSIPGWSHVSQTCIFLGPMMKHKPSLWFTTDAMGKLGYRISAQRLQGHPWFPLQSHRHCSRDDSPDVGI